MRNGETGHPWGSQRSGRGRPNVELVRRCPRPELVDDARRWQRNAAALDQGAPGPRAPSLRIDEQQDAASTRHLLTHVATAMLAGSSSAWWMTFALPLYRFHASTMSSGTSDEK